MRFPMMWHWINIIYHIFNTNFCEEFISIVSIYGLIYNLRISHYIDIPIFILCCFSIAGYKVTHNDDIPRSGKILRSVSWSYG